MTYNTSDPVQTLLQNVQASLRAGVKAGDIKDGNLSVRNIQVMDLPPQRNELPCIKISRLSSNQETYLNNYVRMVPFSIRIVCWVSGNKTQENLQRAHSLRENVISYLWQNSSLSTSGAIKLGLSITREKDEYETEGRFAIGEGFIITGEMEVEV